METADGEREIFDVASPSSALSVSSFQINNYTGANGGVGYVGGVYWNGGGAALVTTQGGSTGSYASPAISSSDVGLQLVCNDSGGCNAPSSGAGISAFEWTIQVDESQLPTLDAQGADNLFYQGGSWVWNPPGDPWPATVEGTDPSGVCQESVYVNGAPVASDPQPRNDAVWQQCPSPAVFNASIDTTDYEPTSGQFTLELEDQNAAQVPQSASVPINVDNIAPAVTITPQNDANPGGWSVNHAVTLQIDPSAGPSGVSGTTCTDSVGGSSSALSLGAANSAGDYDVTINGNGSHDVSCTVENNAVDPQGNHNSATTTQTVDIDEQPPSLTFEPQSAANPAQVVVQTSDDESSVVGGSIAIAPAGSSTYSALATTFDSSNGQLTATVPDGTLRAGAYTIQASATSQVGNGATATENLALPLRGGSSEEVSFARVEAPLLTKRLRERVRVGYKIVTERRHGRTIRVKRGGHDITRTVIERVEQCHTLTRKVKGHNERRKICVRPTLHFQKELVVGHGKVATVYGDLTTAQGLALANQQVTILTAPNDGARRFTAVGSATTDAQGGWKVTLPAGPSRTVEASWAGSATQLPVSGRVHLVVPARISITAMPSTLSWSGVVAIHGQLKGGFVPRDGVAMRLLIRLPNRRIPYSPVPFRTNSKGAFTVKWSWGTGSGVVSYPFSVATTGRESDYPFAAATSNAVLVRFE